MRFCLNITAYHTYPYSGKDLYDFNQRIKALVKKYSSEEKQYWVTEYGIPAIDSEKFSRASYDTQTKKMMQSILVHWATGGSKFFIFSIWDKAVFDPDLTMQELKRNRSYYYGLLEKDMTPKPVYLALKWLSPLLDEYEPLEIQDKGDGILILAKHKLDGSRAYFSWGAQSQKKLFNNRSQNKLKVCKSYNVEIKLNEVKLKVLGKRSNDVLFWR